jgi:hypothetical protein
VECIRTLTSTVSQNSSSFYCKEAQRYNDFFDEGSVGYSYLWLDIASYIKYVFLSYALTFCCDCCSGKINGTESPALKGDTIHSGIAYMSGSDTWYDVPRMFGVEGLQPLKIHLDEGRTQTYVSWCLKSNYCCIISIIFFARMSSVRSSV